MKPFFLLTRFYSSALLSIVQRVLLTDNPLERQGYAIKDDFSGGSIIGWRRAGEKKVSKKVTFLWVFTIFLFLVVLAGFADDGRQDAGTSIGDETVFHSS